MKLLKKILPLLQLTICFGFIQKHIIASEFEVSCHNQSKLLALNEAGLILLIMNPGRFEYYLRIKKKIKKEKLAKQSKKPKQQKLKDKGLIKLAKKIKNASYINFLKSKYWRQTRGYVLKRDEYKCLICGRKSRLEVHHITYKNHFNEHNHLEDLHTICRVCHREYHRTVFDFSKDESVI